MVTQREQERGWANKLHIEPDGNHKAFADMGDRWLRNIVNGPTFRVYEKSAVKKELRRRNPYRRVLRSLKRAETSKPKKMRALARAARKALEKYRKQKVGH